MSKDGSVYVEKTSPDPSCEVTVEYLPTDPDQFYLKSCIGCYFQYHKDQKKKGNHVDNKPTKKNRIIPKRAIPFTLLDLPDSPPETYVFRASNGTFLVLEVNEKKRLILGGFENAKIKIGNPTITTRTGNIVYDLRPEAYKITDLQPEVALKTTVRNDSPAPSTQNLTYCYLVSHKGTWTNEIGVPLPAKTVAGAKIPCLVDGAIIAAENYSHVELYNMETKTATSSVSVPASTKGVATVQIYKANIEVFFTYLEEIWYQSGEHVLKKKKGIYRNVATFGVDIELTDLITLVHNQHYHPPQAA
jgi:hypothetical protein